MEDELVKKEMKIKSLEKELHDTEAECQASRVQIQKTLDESKILVDGTEVSLDDILTSYVKQKQLNDKSQQQYEELLKKYNTLIGDTVSLQMKRDSIRRARRHFKDLAGHIRIAYGINVKIDEHGLVEVWGSKADSGMFLLKKFKDRIEWYDTLRKNGRVRACE